MSERPNRRRVLGLLGATALSLGLAGCSGDGTSGDNDDGGGGETTTTYADIEPDGAEVPGGGDTDDGAATTGPTIEEVTTEPITTAASGASESVTVNAFLRVRESRTGFSNFETFQTGFEGLTVQMSGGEGVQVAGADAHSGFDLAAVTPGEQQQLVQTTIPPGDYEQAAILLPVQTATPTDGSDPEFARMVPATGELGTNGALTLEAGDVIDFTADIAVLRVAGDGPWTYTAGFGTRWQTEA
jgi:hypothetical protein